MLRFIMCFKARYSNGYCGESHYTIDGDLIALEKALKKGGYGENCYEAHELIGAEILEETPQKNQGEQTQEKLKLIAAGAYLDCQIKITNLEAENKDLKEKLDEAKTRLKWHADYSNCEHAKQALDKIAAIRITGYIDNQTPEQK